MEYYLLALKQCLHLSQINIKQNAMHIVIFIVSSSKFQNVLVSLFNRVIL